MKELIQYLETQHKPLSEEFLYNPDKGKYLMFKESQIAEKVMLEMALAYDITQRTPALPIHDSFIVMGSWAGRNDDFGPDDPDNEDLDRAMYRAFKEEIGIECKITFDPREIDLKQERLKEEKRQKQTPEETLKDLLFLKEHHTHKTYNRHHDDWYKKDREHEWTEEELPPDPHASEQLEERQNNPLPTT